MIPEACKIIPTILKSFLNASGDVEIDIDESKNESRIEKKNQG